jgi:signal transduction histidine kinase
MSAQLLTDNRVGGLNPEQQELTKSILDDANRLLNITSELLNMSQVETGNIQLKLQSTTPSAIIEQALQAVQFQAQQKSIDLHSQLPARLPAVQADAEKTSWVLINFLTNAIRYSPESTTIDINVYNKEGKIFFTVTDHGKGIDEKYLPRLFDRYYKVPGTHERNGTGLGLAISKEFIEAQGGQIWVQSQVGEGSLFGFALPEVKQTGV